MAEFTLKDGRTLVIRPATHGDAPAIVEHMKTVGGETDYLLSDENGIEGLTPKGECEYMDNQRKSPRSEVFVGYIGDELATMFGVTGEARLRIAHNANIGLAVKKAFWNLGVGSAVMRTCVDFAKERGIENLTLETRADNLRAQALYRRFGFAECGRHKNRYLIRGEYFDEVLMQLCL